MLASVFLMRSAVRRATGLGYQHSFITLAMLWSTSEACQRFGIFGRLFSMQTTCNIKVNKSINLSFSLRASKAYLLHLLNAGIRLHGVVVGQLVLIVDHAHVAATCNLPEYQAKGVHIRPLV